MPRPKSILWVDDEIEALAPHRRFLETQGFTVASAAHGDDALAMLRRRGGGGGPGWGGGRWVGLRGGVAAGRAPPPPGKGARPPGAPPRAEAAPAKVFGG